MLKISAIEISHWADSLAAKAEFPRLIRRLIHATVHDLEWINIPAGEGIQLKGWDGQVRSTAGNPWVPGGMSVWECGTDGKVKQKADADYLKRSCDPLSIDPNVTTFVFATPRVWPGKVNWAKIKNSEGKWEQVLAFDAHDLEQWLEQAPHVAIWFAEHLEKSPDGLRALDLWWEGFVAATRPPFDGRIIVAGREAANEAISNWLKKEQQFLEVHGDSVDEGIAFIAAAIDSLPVDEKAYWKVRALVVDAVGAWRVLLASPTKLLIVLASGDASVAGQLIQAGHRVIIPLGREASKRDNDVILLPKPSAEVLKNALIDAGIQPEDASKFTFNCGRSLLVLRRQMAVSPSLAIPAWGQAANAGLLSAALLAGAWNAENEADRKAIEALGGLPYPELEKQLRRWLHTSDSPLRNVSSVWQLTAPLDAWLLLGKFLTRDDLEMFKKIAIDILSTPDPRFDLEPDKRWAANVYGKAPPFSGWIRKGIIESLIMLAQFGEQAEVPLPIRGDSFVFCIVRDLLENANDLQWGSLHAELSILAEASPDAFLDAVEDSFHLESSPVMSLFQDEGSLGACLHAGLLWGLEKLAWSPRYLGRTALILAALTRLDPGGQWGNRPSESLRKIFLAWKRETSADMVQRLQALDVVLSTEPDVGWHLLLGLFPSLHEISWPSQEPTWREWSHGVCRDISEDEYSEYLESIGERVVASLRVEDGRYFEVLKHLKDFPEDSRHKVIDELATFAETSTKQQERLRLWDGLRELLHDHRQFPDAVWVLPPADLDRLAGVYALLEPEDMVQRYAWLFQNTWPHFPDGRPEDRNEYDEAVSQERREILRALYEAGGSDFLGKLVEASEQPHTVAIHAAEVLSSPNVVEWILTDALCAEKERLSIFALAFITKRRHMDPQWFEDLVTSAIKEQWPDNKVVALCFALPFGLEAWHKVSLLGREIDAMYWKKVSIWRTEDDAESITYGLKKLLDAGRPREALGIIRFTKCAGVPFHLLASTLEALLVKIGEEKDPHGYPRPYDVGEAFQRMDAAIDKDHQRIFELEWHYLPLLKESKRGTKVIYDSLEDDPLFFAEVVRWVYKSEGDTTEAEDIPSEAVANRASLSYDLLRSWRGLPGCKDGVVSEEVLFDWVIKARERLDATKRKCSGDKRIGEVLARSPVDNDGIWPALPARKLIELFRSKDLEVGMYMGVFNSRGVTSRDYRSGGGPERASEQKYRKWAEEVATAFPMTSRMLHMIANGFASSAERHDESAAAEELRFF